MRAILQKSLAPQWQYYEDGQRAVKYSKRANYASMLWSKPSELGSRYEGVAKKRCAKHNLRSQGELAS